ncbi:thioredoxin family protein [Microbacterium thalassium]|uniref:Thiol-disulfide isomerase/thioredoxin n=1 Tax=Microbacterium thalassium TaxID=362649 RepID=A0A7X0KTI0_9MICO|nr:thioredoxin family protein [Microbacterium thalassium]MBB6390109.1 thiol-disulfide isomerase/thioredoxin [Microbacterium thalassium]GLK25217.1 hypothetical protein GCM10017607_25360 [Microbacterium thalassium]
MKRGTIVGLVVAGVVVLGVGVGAAVALGGGAAGEAASEPTTTVAATPTVVAEPEPEPTETEAAEPAEDDASEADAVTPGAYVEYSEAALASAEGTRVLFFHATWCPKCRSLEASILEEGVPDGVTILKVDYDSNNALRQRYDVRQQTTVVALDEDGEATASFVAYDDPSVGAALAGVGLGG